MRVSVVDLACQLVYYPYMASIVGKKRGNQTYYYLVESARVDGKPRIVAQEYLGSAQEVMDRRSGAGASVGTYLALATANRVVAPCSKLGLQQWWATTAGPRFTKVPVAVTDHRRFWDAMDNLDLSLIHIS